MAGETVLRWVVLQSYTHILTVISC